MKKILCFILCISFVFVFSCAYKADYPDIYTTEYCYKEYVRANPNLRLTFDAKIAKNRTAISSKSESYQPAGFYAFYGIKNIPIDEYLWQRHSLVFGGSECLVRNKNDSRDPIFDYNAISAEIAWRGNENYKSVVQIDVKAIKNVICEAIKAENFVDITQRKAITKKFTPEKNFFNIEPKEDTLFLGIEIVFSEYENLFWRGSIQRDEANDGSYYVTCFIESGTYAEESSRTDIKYKAVYIELPEDISSIIAEIDTE